MGTTISTPVRGAKVLKVWWERLYPFLIAVGITVLVWRIPATAALIGNLSGDVVSAGINIGAIFIGFVATVASILMSINSEAVKFMKRVGKFHVLMNFLWWSIRASFVFVLVSLVWYVAPSQTTMQEILGYAWVFAGAWTLLTTYRATDIAMGLIHISSNEEGDA